jgi:putative inorganic carbon (HCO3(-)) transporter
MVESLSKREAAKDIDKKKWLEFIPTFFILALAALLPLIFLPLNISSFNSTKSTIFSILVLTSLFTWLILKLKDNYFKLPFNLLSLSLFLIPVLYIVATFFSTNFNISFFGSSVDSTLNILITFLLITLVSILFQNIKNTKLLYIVTGISLLVMTLFHLVKLPLLSVLPSFNFF